MTASKMLTGAIFLVALIILIFWAQGGFHVKVQPGTTALSEPPVVAGKTVKAQLIRTEGEITVAGSVTSRETAKIASRVSGNVIELRVDAGDSVTKGQVLLTIDAKEVADRERQAAAALDSANAELARAKNDLERFKALYEKESLAKKDYDDAVARYETAVAAERRAAAALEEARTQLSYTAVTAPFDGVVSSREVNLGDMAEPGRTLLTICKPGTLEMVAAVGEQYTAFLHIGTPVTVAVPSLSLKENSTIREIVPLRDEKTRTITVKAPISDHPGLGPGVYGTLTFKTRSSETVAIPAHAVQIVGQLETVRVVENGKVRIRHVKTGRTLENGNIEILSGINDGEEIVVE